MKLKLFTLLLGVVLLAGSCDEQEFGFNVSKEVLLEIPVDYEVDEVIASLGLNPPATEERLVLGEVDAFSDALSDAQDLGEIVLNSIAYEITDVSAAEETPLDELTISVEAGSEIIELIALDGSLRNVSKTNIQLTQAQLNALVNELSATGNDLNTIVNVDFQQSPSEDIQLNINMFFDITLKIRQSIN